MILLWPNCTVTVRSLSPGWFIENLFARESTSRWNTEVWDQFRARHHADPINRLWTDIQSMGVHLLSAPSDWMDGGHGDSVIEKGLSIAVVTADKSLKFVSLSIISRSATIDIYRLWAERSGGQTETPYGGLPTQAENIWTWLGVWIYHSNDDNNFITRTRPRRDDRVTKRFDSRAGSRRGPSSSSHVALTGGLIRKHPWKIAQRSAAAEAMTSEKYINWRYGDKARGTGQPTEQWINARNDDCKL